MNAHQSQLGFSLVEILVALAILSMAGLALMGSVTQAGRSAILAREQGLAQLAAESVLNTAILEAVSGRGVQPGNGVYALAGIEYRWQLEVAETSDPALRRVVLTLSDDQGPVHRLTTFRRVMRG